MKGGVGWEALRRAYVLIISIVGSEEEALEEVRGIPEVKEAHMVYGVYDIVARVEAETVQGLDETSGLVLSPRGRETLDSYKAEI